MPSQEEIEKQYQLLFTYRRNLAHYLQQQADLGGTTYISLGIANGIRETRENIYRIKGVLRAWGIPFENHPDDYDRETNTSVIRENTHKEQRTGGELSQNKQYIGSSGIAVGENQGLLHQEALEAFFTRSGQIAHEVFSTHGFLTRYNEAREHTFSTGSPKEPIYFHINVLIYNRYSYLLYIYRLR